MKKQTKTLKHPKVNAKTRADYRKALTKFSNDCNKSIKWWLMSKFTNGTANATALSKEFSKLSNYWISRSQAVLKIPVQKMLNKTLNLSDNFFKKQGIKFDNKTKSHDLRNTLNAELNSNLALIKSIPRETILRYESVLYQAINNFDEQSIVKQLKTISGISERRAKFIARDQSAKAQEALTLARGKDLGFEYYEWITAGDERVSGTPGGKYPVPKKGGHYHLDGRIYKIGEPTAIIDSYGTLGKPSQRPNCRCTAALLYIEPHEEVKFIKDSKYGDYYELVNKIDGKPVNPPKPKAKAKAQTKATNKSKERKETIQSKQQTPSKTLSIIKKIENSPQKGRDMLIIGRENFNADIVEYAVKNNKRIAVEKLDEATAKELGFKYPNDVCRTIYADEIAHALNRHGKNSPFVKSGRQKAITTDDISKWIEYSDNATHKAISKDDLGQKVLVSGKQINGYYVVVEQIQTKNNNLAFKTMYFEKGDINKNSAFKK